MGVLHVYLALVALTSTLQGVSALTVTMYPAHAHENQSNDTFRELWITCYADQPLTHCQFKFGDRAHREVASVKTGFGRFNRKRGSCYVNAHRWGGVQGDDEEAMVVGCRVRTDTSDWIYGATSLYISDESRLDLKFQSREYVAAPGETLDVKMSSRIPLTGCAVSRDLVTWTSPSSTCGHDGGGGVCYHGDGLEAGDCGVTLPAVTDADNGVLWFRLTREGAEERVPVRVTVSKPPRDFTMDYGIKRDDAVGDGGSTRWLEAVCLAVGGRPPAVLSWHLGGGGGGGDDETTPLVEGVTSEPIERWAWPHEERTVVSRLKLNLTEELVGQHVSCVAEYRHPDTRQMITRRIELPEAAPDDQPAQGWTGVYVIVWVLVVLYVAVLILTDFTLYSWREERYCFSRSSFFRRESLEETDVIDYHVTLTKRNEVHIESYQVPVQVSGMRSDPIGTYFMSPTAGDKRVSTKAERTLGLVPKSDAGAPNQNKWLAGRQNRTDDDIATDGHAEVGDRVPIYGNVTPLGTSHPVSNDHHDDEHSLYENIACRRNHRKHHNTVTNLARPREDVNHRQRNLVEDLDEDVYYNIELAEEPDALYENTASTPASNHPAGAENTVQDVSGQENTSAHHDPLYSNILYFKK